MRRCWEGPKKHLGQWAATSKTVTCPFTRSSKLRWALAYYQFQRLRGPHNSSGINSISNNNPLIILISWCKWTLNHSSRQFCLHPYRQNFVSSKQRGGTYLWTNAGCQLLQTFMYPFRGPVNSSRKWWWNIRYDIFTPTGRLFMLPCGFVCENFDEFDTPFWRL